MEHKKIKEKGQMAASAVAAVITLIVGVAVSILMLIFTGALAGQTWQQVESDIDSITNTSIKNSVKNAAVSGFEALEQTGSYLPLVVLAIITALIIGVVLSFAVFGGLGGGGRGSVL